MSSQETGERSPSDGRNNSWYSSRLRFAVIVENEGLIRYSDSVYLLKATDYDAAFKRTLETGRTEETEYLNANNEGVAWKLTEVLSLDMILDESLDGAEIYSEPVTAVERSWTIDRTFTPEASHPTQTV